MFRAKIINKQKREKMAEFLHPNMVASAEEKRRPFIDIYAEIKSIDVFEKRRLFEEQLIYIDKYKHTTHSEAFDSFINQLEYDLEEVIDQGFKKLDILNHETLPTKIVR